MRIRRLTSFVLFFSLWFSTEFRAIFQTDGRRWYAVLFSVHIAEDPGRRPVALPAFVHEDSTYLSLREAMYIRNRLEEILDEEEDIDEATEEQTENRPDTIGS